jgi:ATP-dependent RNA helicase DeaD
VHRTGRTGRAGRTGTALSLVGPRDVGNLYLLRLTYKLKPIERQLPSARDKKTREETDLLRMFVEAFASKQAHPSDLALARRLLTHEDAEGIVAGLLRDHLGARPDAVEEATAARRAKNPPPVAEPPPVAAPVAAPPVTSPRPAAAPTVAVAAPMEAPRAVRPEQDPSRETRREPSRDGPRETRGPRGRSHNDHPPRTERSGRPERSELDLPRFTTSPMLPEVQAEPGSADEPSPADHDTSGDDKHERSDNELYVSVGRRDGAKPSDYHSVLEAAGITPESLEYVRVRHRHAFVGVRPEAIERALTALNGAMIAGRRATAERARRD